MIDPTVLVALIGLIGVLAAGYFARQQAAVKRAVETAKVVVEETKASVVELKVTYDGNMEKLFVALRETAALREEAGLLRGRAEGEASIRGEVAQLADVAAKVQAAADAATVAASKLNAQAVSEMPATLASVATQIEGAASGQQAVAASIDSLAAKVEDAVEDTHERVVEIHHKVVEGETPPSSGGSS